MEPEAQNSESGGKLLAARSIRIRIAVASVAILGAGAFLAPRPSETGVSLPQELPAPLIEERVQQRERPFRGVQDAAALTVAYSVAIPGAVPPPQAARDDFSSISPLTRPAGFGVFVSDTHVLTHELALDGRSTAQLAAADDRRLDAQVAAYEPSTGLVLLQTSPAGRAPVTLATEPPVPGTLAVAVGRWDGRDIVIPVFVTSVGVDRYRVGAVNDALLAGMPLFNLDGELFAISAGDGRDGHAFSLPQATIRLAARASSGEPHGSLGIALQERPGTLTAVFGDEGVIVSDVVEGGPADAAGIQAGDVLLAVGDLEVESSDGAARALNSLAAGSTASLRLRRGGSLRTVETTPAPAYQVAALARDAADVRSPGPEARELFDRALLERAGIRGTAQVLSVNGRPPASRAQIERELRRSDRPAVLLLREGSSQFFAAIESTR